MAVNLIPQGIRAKYEIEERHHACAVLKTDFPSEWQDLLDALDQPYFDYYNFCRVDSSFRVTPATAAGIKDRV